MRFAPTPSRFAILLLGTWLGSSAPLTAQEDSDRRGFWLRGSVGYGVLTVSSDQEPRERDGTLAMGVVMGVSLSRHLRVGLQLNGWLREAYDPWDPERGESVSQVFATGAFYPSRAAPFFVEIAGGAAFYTNAEPGQFGSSGWGLSLGGGYDWRLGRAISLTPGLRYARGSLGSVENSLLTARNRRYSAVEISLGVTYR